MRLANQGAVLKSLDELVVELDKRLKAVVRGFIMDVTLIAIKNTPYGDLTSPNGGMDWYPTRSEYAPFASRLDEVPGTARNNWKVAFLPKAFEGFVTNEMLRGATPSGAPFDLPSGSEAGEISTAKVSRDVGAYKLGDMIVLWNDTPYINRRANDWSLGWYGKQNAQGLEQGSSQKAPNGIRQPTVQELMAIYTSGANIKRNFDGG